MVKYFFCEGDVTYAVPKLESTSICHEIISKCKYICLRMTSAIQAKLACVKSISFQHKLHFLLAKPISKHIQTLSCKLNPNP